MVRFASVPLPVGHDLTRTVRFSSPLDPTRPDPTREVLTFPDPTGPGPTRPNPAQPVPFEHHVTREKPFSFLHFERRIGTSSYGSLPCRPNKTKTKVFRTRRPIKKAECETYGSTIHTQRLFFSWGVHRTTNELLNRRVMAGTMPGV